MSTRRSFYVTRDYFDGDGTERKISEEHLKNFNLKYLAYDDDMNLMAEGVCNDIGVAAAYVYHRDNVGATSLKLYDRVTSKYIDSYG